ncbi:ATP-binding cassette domain-containing protein [Heyndrickxia coagulans]|uniref:ATP-binding cassette domain-containing protein n=1 Tax=Heyndrickxia coagulans TaxID=1398 RepID=UPI000AB5772C
MIQIRNLTKKFNEKTLFSNFNLDIESGDFVIVSGPSGCGKTTLLNMIGAIEKFDGGTIIVDGIDIKNKKNHLHYFRTKIGFLFQNFALVDHKTVKDNLKLIRKDCKTNLSMEEALALVGLKNKINQKVFTLSGGEQQRVALARLMLKNAISSLPMSRLVLLIR